MVNALRAPCDNLLRLVWCAPDIAEFDYDLAVIGGGSGGMAAAKKAASFGVKVRTASGVYVEP